MLCKKDIDTLSPIYPDVDWSKRFGVSFTTPKQIRTRICLTMWMT